MFCPKCGAEIAEDSVFCLKCGAKIQKEGEEQSAAEQAVEESTPKTETGSGSGQEPSKKKKSKKPLIIIGIVTAILIVVVLVSGSSGSGTYIKDVQKRTIFNKSQGWPYTIEEVLNAYVDKPDWIQDKVNDEVFVEVGGKLGKSDLLVAVRFKVTEEEGLVYITPVSATVGDERSSSQDEAVSFLYLMFAAYNQGYEDFSDVIEEIGGMVQNLDDMSVCENEGEGYSFEFPSVMEEQDFLADDTYLLTLMSPDLYDPATISIIKLSRDTFDYDGLFVSDEEYKAVITSQVKNGSIENLETSVIQIDGVDVRKIYYEYIVNESAKCNWTYTYGIGNNVYSVSALCNRGSGYKRALEKMMRSYHISVPEGYTDNAIRDLELGVVYSGGGLLGQSWGNISMYSSPEDGEVGRADLYIASDSPIYGGCSFEGTLYRWGGGMYSIDDGSDRAIEVFVTDYNDYGTIYLDLYVDGDYVEKYFVTEQYRS